jgi:hypothetical protein
VKPRGRKLVILIGAIISLFVMGIVPLSTLPAGASAPPSLKVTVAPFHNEQRISISVGPNRFFTPYSHVNILECSDKGGQKKNLPKSVYSCDGNTIQGDTVLVNKNGSFSEHSYEVFALPNRPLLGEQPDDRPECNEKMSCVLYVGQNQENFSSPKVFSRPFTIGKSKKHS